MNRFFLVTLCILAAACLSEAAAATAHPIVPHQAEYRVKISLLRGDLKTRVDAVADGFVAQSEIIPTGLAGIIKNGSIREKSEFVLTPGGIRPRHYESADSLSKREKDMRFDFDWQAGTVAGQINGEAYEFALDGQEQDRVSIQYELMHQLLHSQDVTRYAMLDGDEIKQLTVKNVGVRKVEVPFGEFDAVGIQHSAENSSRVTTLWCVAELGYLPVIIEQHRKGKLRVRAELVSYETLASAADQPAIAPYPEPE